MKTHISKNIWVRVIFIAFIALSTTGMDGCNGGSLSNGDFFV